MIVAGQVLWKIGVEKITSTDDNINIFSSQIVKIISSPYIILGVISYGIATLLYMVLLSKYEYTNLQAVVVSSSLVTTFIAASLFFNEK